jgi:GNAT superfamily N-acetyltransferase
VDVSVEITRATVEDAQAILALQRLAYQCEAERYDDYSLPPLTETLSELQREFDRSVFLKAIGEDGICGSVRAHDNGTACLIGRLIVHPTYRRRGIATRLMAEIEACFPHVARYELFTGCKSQGNLQLYDKLGYRVFREDQPEQGPKLVFLEKLREGMA